MGVMEKALNDFDQAAALDPINPIIYSNRGMVRRKQGLFKEAVQDYTKEIENGS